MTNFLSGKLNTICERRGPKSQSRIQFLSESLSVCLWLNCLCTNLHNEDRAALILSSHYFSIKETILERAEKERIGRASFFVPLL